MARRGRPSNKTLKKRKEARRKSRRYLTIAMIILFVVGIAIYYLFMNQGA